MKFLSLSFLLLFSFTNHFQPSEIVKDKTESKGFIPINFLRLSGYSEISNRNGDLNLFTIIHVDTTLTSANGCSVHIVGDLNFGWFPWPHFNSFTGSVTISGSHGCPNGTLTFSKSTGEDLLVTPDDESPCNTTLLTWSGTNSSFVDILNETAINDALVAIINSACE